MENRKYAPEEHRYTAYGKKPKILDITKPAHSIAGVFKQYHNSTAQNDSPNQSKLEQESNHK